MLGTVVVRLSVEDMERLAAAAEAQGVKWHLAVEAILRVAQKSAVQAVLAEIEAMVAAAQERMEKQVLDGAGCGAETDSDRAVRGGWVAQPGGARGDRI